MGQPSWLVRAADPVVAADRPAFRDVETDRIVG